MRYKIGETFGHFKAGVCLVLLKVIFFFLLFFLTLYEISFYFTSIKQNTLKEKNELKILFISPLSLPLLTSIQLPSFPTSILLSLSWIYINSCLFGLKIIFKLVTLKFWARDLFQFILFKTNVHTVPNKCDVNFSLWGKFKIALFRKKNNFLPMFRALCGLALHCFGSPEISKCLHFTASADVFFFQRKKIFSLSCWNVTKFETEFFKTMAEESSKTYKNILLVIHGFVICINLILFICGLYVYIDHLSYHEAQCSKIFKKFNKIVC